MKTVMFIMPTPGYSGAEKVVLHIIEELGDKYNFIYVSQSGRIDSYLEYKNVKHIITKNRLDRNEIKEIINREKVDIIHCTDYRASVIVASINTKYPIISHVHNNPPWIKYINKNSILYLLASTKFKKILTVSEAIENEFIFSKFVKSKIINVFNPLSRKDILEKITIRDKDKKYDICCVGRTCRQKDPLRFVDIIKEIKTYKSNIKAIMVGDGELFNDTSEYIKKNNLEDNIKMTGFIHNSFDIMEQSKIFCIPSKWEGFGLVAFEALTLGLPCFTTPVGGLVNIVDNECGGLCVNNSEFAENILKLLEDDDLYNKKSKKALEKSFKLDNINQYMNKIDEIYKSVLE